MTLEGRRAVVTGATRGIGAAVARALDECGVRTLLVARNEAGLLAAVRDLHHAASFAADLTHADAPDRIASEAPRLLDGPIDIVVNNAGFFAVAPIEKTNDETLDSMLSLNLAAPFRLLRAFLPSMRELGAGHVITIGSVADRATFAGNAAYAASKFGARALHTIARAELKGTGVRATLVSPGPTDTPLWDPYDPDHEPGFTPRAEMLRAEHVADAVLFALTRPAVVNIDELRLSRS